MNRRIVKNMSSLYVMNIAKMVLPLITLPYLTRVLTKDCYGTVSYIKAVMQYMQLIVDFGFLLSGTKDIVRARNDQSAIRSETWNILGARVILALGAGCVLVLLTTLIPILRENLLYATLSFIPVFLTCFLFDYLFRGLEQMHIITWRFVIMKLISTALTFLVVKSDADMMLIPALDIIGTVVAVILVINEMQKRKIRPMVPQFRIAIRKIKESAVYFCSSIATTAFGALNTIVIGVFLTESEVANWSLCMQLVNAVQSMYTPITNGLYPEMVKSQNISLIKKTLKLFMPIVTGGCIFTLCIAEYAILIIGGAGYVDAVPLLRSLVPVMFFGFPSMLFGWPTLGAIDKSRETTITTVTTAFAQVIGIAVLIILDHFTLITVALFRGITEMLLLILRYRYYRRYRDHFVKT